MLKIFSDFDGTITHGDVGETLFTTFGGAVCTRYRDEYRNGKRSAKECIMLECEACGCIDRRALDAYIDSQYLDPAFPEFVRFCQDRQLEFSVLSDGFDYYIRRILQNYHFEEMRCYSNELYLEPIKGSTKVKPRPYFPYDDEECTRCACCKRNCILTHTGGDDVIAYIGDGYSGQCPVQYADIVFAKNGLQRFCQHQNISYYEFRSFTDVRQRLEQLLNGKHFRKRRAAEMNRQALFMAG